LAASSSSVTFSSITQIYGDLVIVITGSTTANADLGLRFNGDSGANYSFVYMGGNGSTTLSGTAASQPQIVLDAYFWRSTEISTCIAHIMDYSAADKHKTVLSRNNVAGGGTDAFANRWANTAAITSVEIRNPAQSFASGTTFSLYGVIA
jgi:hypothetical protein